MISSLRVRLLVSTLAVFAVAWLLVAFLVERSVQRQMFEQFDMQLEQQRQFLQVIVRHEAAEADVGAFSKDLDEANLQIHFHGHRYVLGFRVWSPDGELLLKSEGVPELPLAQNEVGYSEIVVEGERWRTLAGTDPETNYRMTVGYHVEDREVLANGIVHETLHPLSLTMMVLAMMLWYVVGHGLTPLKKLASEILGRHPLALHTVNLKSVPSEVQPLVLSLNALFRRLEEAFESYDNFTANAAHELRTPLSGLALQVEASLRATTETDRQHALKMVRRGVERACHIVEQMLDLARLGTLNDTVTRDSMALYPSCRTAVENLGPLARERDVEVILGGRTDVQVRGNSNLVEIMISNLVRNAILYSPRGARVVVETGHDEQHPYIIVEDSGPGIPAEMRGVVQQRFTRLPETGGEGAGLGLAIVRRIVDLHQGELEFTDRIEESGLRVIVTLPSV